MANFETFRWNFSSSINLLFLKSEGLVTIFQDSSINFKRSITFFFFCRYVFWPDFKTKTEEIAQGPFSWFYTFVGFTGVGIFSLIVSHCLLAYGAYKENHKFLKKWLITNVIVFTVLLVFVLALLFTGFHLLKVNESQFTWILVLAGTKCQFDEVLTI